MTKLPKPKGQRLAYRCVAGDGEDEYEDFYTEAQMLQFRRDALEEAAMVCDEYLQYPSLTPKHCADHLRALKDET
jgi:hypothetical protein